VIYIQFCDINCAVVGYNNCTIKDAGTRIKTMGVYQPVNVRTGAIDI
jgi:hypothetical protein